MKKLLVILFLLISNFGFSQQVISPDPKSFTLNTTGQDASGFVLSGFNTTDILLCAIGLPSAPTGTTFYLTTTTNLTASVGYTMVGNKTRLTFTGTMANINNALATLKINTTATSGTVQISVSATINPTGYYYYPVNGHFYKPVSTGAIYPTAKTNAHATTFKGQEGYLLTLTSAGEEDFIKLNVPQSNIWFAATDKVIDGTWVIDDGPEMGTVMKTSNGQYAGNVQGVYNNWCGGEPNGYNHGEDYPVAKWNGAACWNDLNPNYNNPYVIEYGTWSNPDNQTFTDFYSNSTSHSNGNVLRAQFNFNFGPTADETIFKTKISTSSDNINFVPNPTGVSLNGIGRVDMTNQMDTTMIVGNGKKAFTTTGQVEWCVLYQYDAISNGHRVLIDSREFGGTNVNYSDVTSLQLFDIYNGPVTFINGSLGGWIEYFISGNLTTTISSTTYSSKVRLQDNWYGIGAEFTFGSNTQYKHHKIGFDNLTTTQTQTLLNNIVSVSDVYLAFKEYSDRGLMGNESKYLQNGIQLHNADVNEDGYFDERDCYLLLQHLQGTTSLWSTTPTINDAMKLIPSTTYDGITKQNWNTFSGLKKSDYQFTFSNGVLNSYSLDVTWKGDVNLSHSSQPIGFVASATNNPNIMTIKSMSTTSTSIGDVQADIMMEKVGENIVATINVIPNGNQIGATQFNVHFDNTLLDFVNVEHTNTTSTNFGKNNGSFISVGSLNTSGGSISNIGYKITFKPKTIINNLLGLISINSVETLGTNLNKLNVKVL
jgi:hypothetical protein